MKNIKQKLGFSLVELMIVVAVLGAMTALGVPAINAFAESDAKRVCGNQLNSVRSAIILAGDNDVTFVKEVPINQNTGLTPFLKNLDEMCCPDSGDYYIITNANRIYCPNHNIYSSLIPIEIDTSGGTVNPGDIEPDRPASSSSSSSSSKPASSSSSSSPAPAPCSHVAGTPVTTKEATCTEDGVARISCTICSEIIETQTVTALGHDYIRHVEDDGTQNNTQHTCSRCGIMGNHDYQQHHNYFHKCSLCSETLVHRFVASADGKTHTCLTCGFSYNVADHNFVSLEEGNGAAVNNYHICEGGDCDCGVKYGHTYVYRNANTHKCSICGEIQYHDYDDANPTCTKCGADKPAACEHNYVLTSNTATCTADGVKTYTCSNCEDSYEEEASATGHSYSYYSATKHKCNSCSVTEDHISSSVVSYTYPLYSTSGSMTHYCAKCNSNYTESLSSSRQYCGLGTTGWGTGSTEHNMVPTVTAPTCTTDGYTTYKCNKTITYNYRQQTCTFSYVSDYVPATGHNFVDGVCSSCGATN